MRRSSEARPGRTGEARLGWLLLALFLVTGCGRAGSGGTDLAVILRSEPSPARVGDNLLVARVAGREGEAAGVAAVRFHYYPFVHRTKDSLASPDEVVRVVEGEKAPEGYRVKATFDKPGPWKVTLKVSRESGPDVLVTFTLDVRA